MHTSKRIKTNTDWDLYEEWFIKPYAIYMYFTISHNLPTSVLNAFKTFWLAPEALHYYLLSQMQLCAWQRTPIPCMYVKEPFKCIFVQLVYKQPDARPYLKVELINGSLTYQLKRTASISHFLYGTKKDVDIIDFVKQLINFISD